MARIRSPRPEQPRDVTGAFVEDLVKTFRGEDRPDGPVVFEIAQGGTGYIQVVIVWERWQDLSADLRDRIVLDAYQELHREHPEEISDQNISMILPVTAAQAVQMRILPYAIQPSIPRSDPEYQQILPLMKQQGAIDTDAGTELRLPTLEMANVARDRLQSATGGLAREIRWQVFEQVGPIHDYQ